MSNNKTFTQEAKAASDMSDLVNRQKLEIENLKIELQAMRNAANGFKKSYNEAKSEAVKEFAKKLKTHRRKMSSSDFSGEFWDIAVLESDIDNLVKEMAEEK